MVADNNIYIRYSPVTGEDFRLTSTGQPSLFYNGVPDWLYQGKYFAESKSELNLFQSVFTSEEEPLYHEHKMYHISLQFAKKSCIYNATVLSRLLCNVCRRRADVTTRRPLVLSWRLSPSLCYLQRLGGAQLQLPLVQPEWQQPSRARCQLPSFPERPVPYSESRVLYPIPPRFVSFNYLYNILI